MFFPQRYRVFGFFRLSVLWLTLHRSPHNQTAQLKDQNIYVSRSTSERLAIAAFKSIFVLLHASEAVACNSQSHGRSEIVLNVNMAI